MFHSHDKKTPFTPFKPLRDLTAVISPEDFLSEPKRKIILQNLMDLMPLEKLRFDSICLNLVKTLNGYYQQLPDTFNGYYAIFAGLFDHAFNRTEAALQLLQQFMVTEQHGASERQALWCYALFSASMLQGIGKLSTDYHVELFDVHGQPLHIWNPIIEDLATNCSYYHYTAKSTGSDDLRRLLNVLLAREIMPTSGFAWIASDQEVLAAWLALLHENYESAGTFGMMFIRAEAIAIQLYLDSAQFKVAQARGTKQYSTGTFIDRELDVSVEKSALAGQRFINWLKNSLESGHLILNKSPLLMASGGIVMCEELFQLFVREHPAYKNWQAVQRSFWSIGLQHVSREDASLANASSSDLVLTDYAVVLPDTLHSKDAHTGKVATITAIELLSQTHLAAAPQHLNGAGDWNMAGPAPALSKPGLGYLG